MKIMQNQGKLAGFRLDMTNVIAAQINSQLLLFVTDSSVKVSEAKVRTVSDQLIDLVPSSQANAFSLTNLPVGVYTLDIITQKGNAKAAYEGILVVGQEPTNVQTKTIIERQIIREERDDEDDEDCDPSYPDTCIPSPPPYLNCDDISFRNFKVIGSDPHGFDGDNDGIGCESNSPRPPPICIQNSDAEGCPPLPRPPECPQGFVGKPPFCEPVDCNENPDAEGCEGLTPPPSDPCDTDNPPDYCEEPICTDPSCAPTECPDGRIVPPGQSCDEEEDEEEDESENTPPKEISDGGDGDEDGDEQGGDEQGGDEQGGDEGSTE
jgi:hypothetical protein